MSFTSFFDRLSQSRFLRAYWSSPNEMPFHGPPPVLVALFFLLFPGDPPLISPVHDTTSHTGISIYASPPYPCTLYKHSGARHALSSPPLLSELASAQAGATV